MEKKFVKFLNNKSNILIDAPHAKKPKGEIYTGYIAEKIAVNNNFNCVISLISRTEADLNRSIDYPLPLQKMARLEYIETLKELYNSAHSNKPYIHLAIHGMKDEYGYDIEIGTIFDEVCNQNIRKKFTELLKENFNQYGLNPNIRINEKFYGHPSLKEIKLSNNYNIIQMEISRTYRTEHKDKVIKVLSKTLKYFNLSP